MNGESKLPELSSKLAPDPPLTTILVSNLEGEEWPCLDQQNPFARD